MNTIVKPASGMTDVPVNDPSNRPTNFRIWQLIALATAVCAFSLQLVPRGDDLVSLNFANSERAEKAFLELESEVASGHRTAHSIGSLARAKVQRGDIEGAVALLNGWLHDHPNDQSAKRFLDELPVRSPTLSEIRIAQLSNAIEPNETTPIDDAITSAQQIESSASGPEKEITRKADMTDQLAIQSLQLVRGFEQAGQFEKASLELRTTTRPINDAAWLGEYARLNIALKSTVQGLSILERLPQPDRGLSWAQAWALMATANAQSEDVLSWLKTNKIQILDKHFIRDLMYLANSQKAPALVTLSAQLLIDKSAQKDDHFAASEMLFTTGQSAQAMAIARRLRDDRAISTDQYRRTLEKAWRSGEPVAQELKQEILATRAADQPRVFTESDIHLLLELGANAETIPALASLAEANPDRWLGVLTKAAQSSNQMTLLVPVLNKIADAPGTDATLRNQIAFRLLEANEKVSAERIFRSIALKAEPNDSAMRQLLFLWGPRPRSTELDWLEARASAASNPTRHAWLRLIGERGGEGRVIKLASTFLSEQTDPMQQSGHGIVEVYVNALLTKNEVSRANAFLRERAIKVRTIADLNMLVHFASDLNDKALDRLLVDAARNLGTDDLKLQRTLGFLAYRVRDWLSAERWLTSAYASDSNDFETARILGEVHQHNGNQQAARRLYESALALLDRRAQGTGEIALSRLSILQKLGRTKEALREYEWLLSLKENDDELRADYASLLVSTGDTKSALAIIGGGRK